MEPAPQTHRPRPRVANSTLTASGGSPSRQCRGGSPHDAARVRGRARSRGSSHADRVRNARITKPSPRPRASSHLSPGPGGTRRSTSPADDGEGLALLMRGARATLALSDGPVVVAGGGSPTTGFLAPGWRVEFVGPDGWTYGSASMFMLAQWAQAAAEGRVRGLPNEGEMEEVRKAKYTNLWKRIIQSTDARKQASMCAEAGLDWSAWRGGKEWI
jgi:hypothetical protein